MSVELFFSFAICLSHSAARFIGGIIMFSMNLIISFSTAEVSPIIGGQPRHFYWWKTESISIWDYLALAAKVSIVPVTLSSNLTPTARRRSQWLMAILAIISACIPSFQPERSLREKPTPLSAGNQDLILSGNLSEDRMLFQYNTAAGHESKAF